MKASWLSKIDPRKKTGSLVIWLKNKLAADYLLRYGASSLRWGSVRCFLLAVRTEHGRQVVFQLQRLRTLTRRVPKTREVREVQWSSPNLGLSAPRSSQVCGMCWTASELGLAVQAPSAP